MHIERLPFPPWMMVRWLVPAQASAQRVVEGGWCSLRPGVCWWSPGGLLEQLQDRDRDLNYKYQPPKEMEE
jgi:hypothetical protein